MQLRAGLALAMAVALTGCGLPPEARPTAEPDLGVGPAPEMVEPPPLAINGTPGRPVTWCWQGGCTDGFLHDPSLAPAIAPPFVVQLPPDSRIEGVRAIGPGGPGRQKSVQVPFTGVTVGEVPDGAIMLNVFVRFAAGGDASYYWALNRPPDTPLASPEAPPPRDG